MEDLRYLEAKSWPFQEARRLLEHVTRKGKAPGSMVTFETGFGRSGLPHVGTFSEVVRTLWVMRAFEALTNYQYPTRLIMFSDDYDALRRVPDDMPEWMGDCLGYRLSAIPNPYETPETSFSEANNIRLVDFVDGILRDYDGSVVGSSPERSRVSLVSSTDCYRSGKFNDQLAHVWRNHDAILDILLPTFKEERRATYCAFMPISGPLGKVDHYVQGPAEIVKDWDLTVVHRTQGFPSYSTVLWGMSKLQWKVDWAMRWIHFDVDYEMSGKDLIDSVRLSGEICRALGGTPPVNLTYELFLDEQGAKISKSRGNGFTVDQWLRYGDRESLLLFMFQNPRAAKKLYGDMVPGMVDQCLKLRSQEDLGPNDAPWHFTGGAPARLVTDISYSLLLNLAVVAQARSVEDLERYVFQMRGGQLSPQDVTLMETLVPGVLRYAEDRGLFNRETREPTDLERRAMWDLATRLEAMMPQQTAEEFQYQVYEVGKAHDFPALRDWFKALYECLLGSSDGPRFGALTKAYGLKNTTALLRAKAGGKQGG